MDNADTPKTELDPVQEILGVLRPNEKLFSVEESLARVLEIVRTACRADSALLLRKLDEVTAAALYQVPNAVLPSGTTSTVLLQDLPPGGVVAYGPDELPRTLPARLRGALTIICCGTSNGRCALILIRRSGVAFERELESVYRASQSVVHLLLQAQNTRLQAEGLAARFDAMVLTLPHGLIFVDDSGDEAWLNDAAAGYLRLPSGLRTPAEVAQAMRGLHETVDNKDEVHRAFTAIFANPQLALRDARFVRVGPPRLVLSVSTTPIIGRERKGRLWLIMDVTTQHFAQQDLEEKNQALTYARHQADAANIAKSRFLAAMSHEIRTPMNGVVGMVNLLFATPLNDTQRDYIDTIRKCSDGLLAIINDILDFSKIEAGFLSLEQRPFNLRGCVQEVVELLRAKAQERNLELRVAIAEDVPAGILGDVMRLRQVLLNLVGNALKFTHHGAVRIEVKKHEPDQLKDQLKDQLYFCVRDTGIGISQEQRAKLFQSFTQADASTARLYGGSGLGLAICKRLVELFGGQIWVDSEVGAGSAFQFTMRAEAADLPIVTTSAPQPVIDESLAATRALSILVVEDNPLNQKIVRLQLQQYGIVPALAENGREAIHAITRQNYDVILMDVQMPEMNGLDATRRLRRLALARQPYVIAMTANAMSEDQQECLDAGMDEVITKPWKPAELLTALSRVAARRHDASFPVEKTQNAASLDVEALAQVRELTGGDPEALAQLIDEHLESYARLQKELRAALADHDLAAMRRTVHVLIGATGYFGEKEMVRRIGALYTALRAEKTDEIAALTQSVFEEHDAVREALCKLRNAT